MYKIKILVYGLDETYTSNLTCTNRTKGIEHKTNAWNKLEDDVYTCNDCGCRVTIGKYVDAIEEEYSE